MSVADLSFMRSGLSIRAEHMEYRSTLNQHSVVRLKAPRVDYAVQDARAGAPVRVSWSTTGLLVGYVHGFEDRGSFRVFTVVGASWPLKSESLRGYENRTAGSIARDITEGYGLSAEFYCRDRRLDRFVSAQSDWASLVELGKRVGAQVVADGATVKFIDVVSRALEADVPRVLSLDSEESVRPVKKYSVSGLRERRASLLVGGDVGYEVSDTNPLNLPHSERMVVAHRAPDQVATDAEMLRRFHPWSEEMVVPPVHGDPSFRAGEPVLVERRDADDQTLWVISEVAHITEGRAYRSELTLRRFRSLYPVLSVSANTDSLGTLRRKSPVRYVNDRWVAA